LVGRLGGVEVGAEAEVLEPGVLGQCDGCQKCDCDHGEGESADGVAHRPILRKEAC